MLLSSFADDSTATRRPGKRSFRSSSRRREHSLAAVGAGSDHAAFAQDAEVVGEGCLREAELEGAACALVALGELSDDLEACRVAQRVEYGRELQLVAGGVMWLSHAAAAAPMTVVESSMIV